MPNNSDTKFSQIAAIHSIKSDLESARDALDLFLRDKTKLDQVYAIAKRISESLQTGGKILSFGNGGSMCDAMHFAEELSGRFIKDRRPLAAIALSDPAHLSCVANDFGYAYVFSRQVEALVNEKDLVLGISTSGNSENIIQAFTVAKQKSAQTIALLGNDGGRLLALADFNIVISAQDSARIQEMHIKIIHILIHLVEKMLNLD